MSHNRVGKVGRWEASALPSVSNEEVDHHEGEVDVTHGGTTKRYNGHAGP